MEEQKTQWDWDEMHRIWQENMERVTQHHIVLIASEPEMMEADEEVSR